MADYVEDVVARFVKALEPDDVVLGGGNVKHLKELPPHCRAGDNANAFLGGFRLWDRSMLTISAAPPAKSAPSSQRVEWFGIEKQGQAAGA